MTGTVKANVDVDATVTISGSFTAGEKLSVLAGAVVDGAGNECAAGEVVTQ